MNTNILVYYLQKKETSLEIETSDVSCTKLVYVLNDFDERIGYVQ